MSAVRSQHQTTFTPFSELAPELRDEIWRISLPEDLGHALYSWEADCQSHRLRPLDDPTVPDDVATHQLFVDFDRGKLGGSQVLVPPAFVNHEAHSIAQKWVQRHGVKYDAGGGCFWIPFSSESDAMFVRDASWKDFYQQYNLRLMDLRTNFDTIFIQWADVVRNLAISKALLQTHIQLIPHIFISLGYGTVKVLLIVINDQSSSFLDESGPGRRLRFVALEGGSFFWDQERDCFERRSRRHSKYEDSYELIEQAITVFTGPDPISSSPASWGHWDDGFEVRPVLAVDR